MSFVHRLNTAAGALTLSGALLVLPGIATPALAAAFRCISPDGGVVYQDRNCPPGSRTIPVDDTPNQGFRFAEDKDIRRLNRPAAESLGEPRRRTIRSRARVKLNADERRFVTSGMHVGEVKRRIGPPDHIVRLSQSATRTRPHPDARQRWVYLPADEDPQTTTTLTVKSGLVLHVERKVTR